MLDDYGWANIGFHRNGTDPKNEVVTPVFDSLAAEGLILDRHYVYQFCSPTRSAFQTGRNPIHVNVLNSPVFQHNPDDPVSGFEGIPRNMVCGFRFVSGNIRISFRYPLLPYIVWDWKQIEASGLSDSCVSTVSCVRLMSSIVAFALHSTVWASGMLEWRRRTTRRTAEATIRA